MSAGTKEDGLDQSRDGQLRPRPPRPPRPRLTTIQDGYTKCET